MTNYHRGAYFERRVQRYYEKLGYLVIRSAGSHSPIDLVALKAGEVKLIQCKVNGVIRVAARQQLECLSTYTIAQVFLISRQGKKIMSEEIREEGNHASKNG